MLAAEHGCWCRRPIDAIIADAADPMTQCGVNLDTARAVIVADMLGEQPLPRSGR